MKVEDLPINPDCLTSPFNTTQWSLLAPHLGPMSCPQGSSAVPFSFDHRHVQFALKYDRILRESRTLKYDRTRKAKYSAYLEQVLAPLTRESEISSPTGCHTRLRYEAIPRISAADWSPLYGGHVCVSNHFAVKFRWEYRTISHDDEDGHHEEGLVSDEKKAVLFPSEGVKRESMGCLEICPRLKLCQPSCPVHGRSGDDGADNPFTEALGYVLLWTELGQGWDEDTQVSSGDRQCEKCLTCFTIKASGPTRSPNPTYLEIEAYRDLGTEGLSPWCAI